MLRTDVQGTQERPETRLCAQLSVLSPPQPIYGESFDNIKPERSNGHFLILTWVAIPMIM